MSALCQLTLLDQGGGLGEEVTADQVGSPDRLGYVSRWTVSSVVLMVAYLMDTTSHSRATAALHILLPSLIISIPGDRELKRMDSYRESHFLHKRPAFSLLLHLP